MREQFEKLPEIKEHLEYCRYSESKNKYISNWYNTMFINGAWYAYQEQQKRIGLLEKRNKVLSEALYVKTDAYYFNEIMQKIGAIK